MTDPERDDRSDLPPERRSSGVFPRAPGEASLEMPVLERSHAAATWGPMTIVVWDGRVRARRVSEVLEVARAQCRRHPDGGGFTLVVRRHTGLPSGDVRGSVSGALADMGGFIHCATVVIEGEGFLAATARSVVSLLFLASGRAIPMKVFADLREAALWQARNLDRARLTAPIGGEEYAQILRAVLDRHDEARAVSEKRTAT